MKSPKNQPPLTSKSDTKHIIPQKQYSKQKSQSQRQKPHNSAAPELQFRTKKLKTIQMIQKGNRSYRGIQSNLLI